MQWYYALNGQRQGPVAETEFERLVREGVIRPETLVWRQGMPDWLPYSQVAPAVSAGAIPALPASGDTGGAASDDTAFCAVSGKRYPKREMIQYEGKWVSAEHRDTFFQRIREGISQPNELRFAGFWLRLLAKIIDVIILWVVFLLISLPFGISLFSNRDIIDGTADIGALLIRQALLTLANMAVALLYDWFFVSRFQATPGKMALGLKIVRPDGSKLSNARVIGRHFAEILSYIILGIGYIIVAFDDEKRALHDHVCDTRVIKTR